MTDAVRALAGSGSASGALLRGAVHPARYLQHQDRYEAVTPSKWGTVGSPRFPCVHRPQPTRGRRARSAVGSARLSPLGRGGQSHGTAPAALTPVLGCICPLDAHVPNLQPANRAWGVSDLADVVAINRELNERTSDQADIIRFHADPPIVFKGVSDHSDLVVGPGTA